jgi:hypothetical protein
VDLFSERRLMRTRSYTGGLSPTSPAGVSCAPDLAETLEGQAAVLTAVNLLGRSHPSILLRAPDVPLVQPSPFGGASLVDACHRIVTGIDPTNRFESMPSIPDHVPTIGLGAGCGPATVYCGGRLWTAVISPSPLDTIPDRSSLIGLGLAVTQASAAIFRLSLGMPVLLNSAISLWNLDHSDQPTGPSGLAALDIGSVWLVGAGAVGSCLAWWVNLIGVRGQWIVIDHDVVKVLNLDRSLAFLAADTGEFGGTPALKAEVVAGLLNGATSFPKPWCDWTATDPPSPDVLFLAANEGGVRPAVAAYSHPAVLAATTSHNWTVELHRHLVLRDGCVTCRFPESAPVFECAAGDVNEPTAQGAAPNGDVQPSDMSLPFLSATAGLLGAVGLLHVQYGHWPTHHRNHWAVGFDPRLEPLSSRTWPHWRSCGAVADVVARRAIHGRTRWSILDPGLVS